MLVGGYALAKTYRLLDEPGPTVEDLMREFPRLFNNLTDNFKTVTEEKKATPSPQLKVLCWISTYNKNHCVSTSCVVGNKNDHPLDYKPG